MIIAAFIIFLLVVGSKVGIGSYWKLLLNSFVVLANFAFIGFALGVGIKDFKTSFALVGSGFMALDSYIEIKMLK